MGIDEIRACVAPLFVAKGATRAVLFGPVDLFVYREAEIEALRDRPFVRRVLAEGKVIFE